MSLLCRSVQSSIAPIVWQAAEARPRFYDHPRRADVWSAALADEENAEMARSGAGARAPSPDPQGMLRIHSQKCAFRPDRVKMADVIADRTNHYHGRDVASVRSAGRDVRHPAGRSPGPARARLEVPDELR
jgi:hypothetical protein